MDKIRICLVGAGRAGEVHGDAYYNCVPNAEIVAVFDTDIQKAAKLANKYSLPSKSAFTSYEDALSGPKFDAAVITTPTFTHPQYAQTSAQNNINVFCEKPMAITIDDCNKMIDAAKKANIILQIGFMRRFDTGFSSAKAMIESGEIGDPLIISSVGRGPGLPGSWAYDIKNSNGNLAEVNSHDFDSVRWLSASEYKKIYAVAKNSKNPDIGKKYPSFYDNATVSATMANQVFGLISSVCPCDYGYDARAEVVGTKGVLFIGSLSTHTIVSCTREKQMVSPQVLSWKKRFQDAYIAEDRHFVDCIMGAKAPMVSGEDGKKAVEAVIAANQSVINGIPVEV